MSLYNNPAFQPYSPMATSYQAPQMNPSMGYHPNTNSSGITWVQGIEGAKAYQMSPNTIMQLMDSENDGIFYIKVSDNIGMSNLRVFKYEEIEATPKNDPKLDLSAYVRKDELQELISSMSTKQEGSNEQPISTAQSKYKNTITQ